MSSMVPRSATSIYIGTVAAVTTIAVSIILFHKLGETGKKGISKQGQPNTSQPQFIDQDAARDEDNSNISIPAYFTGDDGHLCISESVPSSASRSHTTSDLQFIDQDARDKSISLSAQASTTSRPHGDIASEEVPSIKLSQGSSNFQISETNATIIRNGDELFPKIQRNLAWDYITNLIMLPNFDHNLKKHVMTQPLITLPRAEAVFNDYQQPCFKDTRMALLREMADCVTGSSECRMYVLSGRAGIGKSTVAYTIASRAADLNLLGALFVFSRDAANRNNANRFFTTIAYQLCVYNETFAKAIGGVLETKRGSAATMKNPQDQLRALILEPLRNIVQSRSRPILIVVDALDECDEEDMSSVLTGLSQLVQDLPSFKVILTTRPRPHLDRFLDRQGSHKFIYLKDIENMVVGGDIRLYLDYCLSLDQVQKHFPKRQWCASDEEIDSLVCSAGSFFIIASTAVRYILDKTASNPAGQMQKLLHAIAQDYIPFKGLDRCYTVILRDVVPEDCDDDGIVSRYKSVVGTIIFARHPLSVSTLAHLIGIDVEEIRAVLDKLQSVVLLGDDDVPHIYHKSFPEYLMDQARCKDARLRIDPSTCHTQIATRCFEVMDKYLKRNILGLDNAARFMSNEDGFKEARITDEQLQEKIPQQLRYACVYWVNHFEVGNIEDAALMNGLEKFANEHMLHCFEVLSLIGKLDLAHPAIDLVLRLLKSTSSDLHLLLLDAVRFIGRFYNLIKQSALHTYYSALPFTPTHSFLHRRYIKEAGHIIEGGPDKWDALIANLSHVEQVDVVKFSLDSALLVSFSTKSVHNDIRGKLMIWDAATGTPISTIQGHRFAVTNDFSTVVSSEDKTITFYNVNGSTRGAMLTTSSKIKKLALSSEHNRVAAALSDGTVWLWDSRNAELINSFDGFSRNGQLEFSPTGTRLAYSSRGGRIKLCDGINGGFIADLICGSGSQFKFSDDGSRIASVSNDPGLLALLRSFENLGDTDDIDMDDSLTLWNSENGMLIAAVRDVGHKGLAISADGSLLATTDNNQVTLWSEHLSHLAEIKVLESTNTRSMVFSRDNILAIEDHNGLKFYNVNARTFIHTLAFGKWPVALRLAFSPDCTRFAIGDCDGNVNLFDIRGIDASSPPLKINATAVTALTISRDCSRLACGFEDGTVELWGTSSTKRRIVCHHQAHETSVRAFGFGPDSELFASRSDDGTIKLWNGEDGSLCATIPAPSGLGSVALSGSLLVAAGTHDVTLWNLDTLCLIHIFKQPGDIVSVAENNTLVAVTVVGDSDDSEEGGNNEESWDNEDSDDSEENWDNEDCGDSGDSGEIQESKASTKSGGGKSGTSNVLCKGGILLLDVVNRRTVTTFHGLDEIHTMTFLPNNLQLVAQSKDGVFLSIDLIDKHVARGATLERLLQLPNISLWHDIPIWHCLDKEQHYFSALFPRHRSPVPLLWIPRDIPVTAWAQGSSMIALGCKDGRILLQRLPNSHVG